MSEQRFQATLDPYLPWDPLPGESRRIRILMAIFVGFAVVWTLVQPHIKIPVETRAQKEAIPERLATLVLEEKKKPPPPPPKPVEELQKPDETKPKEAEKPKDVPQVEPVEPKAVQMDAKTAAARARAKQEIDNAGIQDQLSDLRDMNFDSEPKPAGAAAGPGAGLITDTQAAGTSRNLIGSRAGTGSGGSAALGYNGSQSSGFGGGAAGGKGSKGGALGLGNGKMAAVQSKIASDLAVAGAGAVGKDGKAQRTEENVAKGFDAIGGKLNSAYQKALRDNPNLQGNVTIKLTIAADGTVNSCTIAASELNDPGVEGRICTIVKGFNFGADGNDPWTGKHVIAFLPGG